MFTVAELAYKSLEEGSTTLLSYSCACLLLKNFFLIMEQSEGFDCCSAALNMMLVLLFWCWSNS